MFQRVFSFLNTFSKMWWLSEWKVVISSHFDHMRALSTREIDTFQSFSPCARIIETWNWHFLVISTMNVHYRNVKLTFLSHFYHMRALSKREIDILWSFPPCVCIIETWNWHFSDIFTMCVHYRDSQNTIFWHISTILDISLHVKFGGKMSK